MTTLNKIEWLADKMSPVKTYYIHNQDAEVIPVTREDVIQVLNSFVYGHTEPSQSQMIMFNEIWKQL